MKIGGLRVDCDDVNVTCVLGQKLIDSVTIDPKFDSGSFVKLFRRAWIGAEATEIRQRPTFSPLSAHQHVFF
jgi:hypothetical protein